MRWIHFVQTNLTEHNTDNNNGNNNKKWQDLFVNCFPIGPGASVREFLMEKRGALCVCVSQIFTYYTYKEVIIFCLFRARARLCVWEKIVFIRIYSSPEGLQQRKSAAGGKLFFKRILTPSHPVCYISQCQVNYTSLLLYDLVTSKACVHWQADYNWGKIRMLFDGVD